MSNNASPTNRIAPLVGLALMFGLPLAHMNQFGERFLGMSPSGQHTDTIGPQKVRRELMSDLVGSEHRGDTRTDDPDCADAGVCARDMFWQSIFSQISRAQ
jgi:hypothetical protein